MSASVDALVENAEKRYWETGDGQVDARRRRVFFSSSSINSAAQAVAQAFGV